VIADPRFVAGAYTTEFGRHLSPAVTPADDPADLAAIVALAYMHRGRQRPVCQPPAFTTGWHHDSRGLPG
jgi:hypothetical protein